MNKIEIKEVTRKWAANLSILLVIVIFCFLCVDVATADSYTYTLSGGPSLETSLVVDDDLKVAVNSKIVFIDNDGVSTHDGRATWKGAPITFSASPGDVLRIIATNPGGVDIELSPLYLHVNGQSLKLSDGVPLNKSEVDKFFNESFIISIPSPLVTILDYSPSPVHEGEDLNVNVSWSNIPAGWKLNVSLEESERNYTRLADDESKTVSGSGEVTFTLKVYPTAETHSEAKVCACFYNEKGEWTGIFDKKNVIGYPTIIPPLIFGIIALIILITGIFVVRRKLASNTKQKKSRSRKLNRKTLSELSKLMAYILQHDKKQEFHVDLDENCCANVDQLVKAISSIGKWRWVNRKHIEEVAAKSFYRGKRRFVIKRDKIKATYRITSKCPSTPTPKPTLRKWRHKEEFGLSIERTIYDPTKRDLVISEPRPLPNIKNWVEKSDPAMYWFITCINNDSNKPIDEWEVELELPSTLKIVDAKIGGEEQKRLEVKEIYLKFGMIKHVLGITHQSGIVIPRKGTRHVYFKLGSDACGVSYTIKGKVSSPDGETPIKEKQFKYSCDVNTLDNALVTYPKDAKDFVSSMIRSHYTGKEAVRIIDSFEEIIGIFNVDDKTRTDELKSKLKQLRSLIFEDSLLNKIDVFYRGMEQELFDSGYLDSNYARRTKQFCEEFIKDWKGEFLR